MTAPTLLLVTYRLRVPPGAFRPAATGAAHEIARAPGLRWKIWGLDDTSGEGTSFYLFDDAEAARSFADGPAIRRLRQGPAGCVTVRTAPVDLALSTLTGATALAAASPAAA